jgi:thiol-disulfide isomerase/thioredoxin
MKIKFVKFFLVVFSGMFFLVSCSSSVQVKDEKLVVPVIDFEGFRPALTKQNDTTYVINFWATWCAPCIKEIPYFEKLNADYANEKLSVILVNLDFPNHYDSRLIPFINDNNIKSKVIMLDDPNSNYWINEVDPTWTGAIPATLIYNRNKREFYEKEFSYEELKEIIDNFQ